MELFITAFVIAFVIYFFPVILGIFMAMFAMLVIPLAFIVRGIFNLFGYKGERR
jgi:hypothetical protein